MPAHETGRRRIVPAIAAGALLVAGLAGCRGDSGGSDGSAAATPPGGSSPSRTSGQAPTPTPLAADGSIYFAADARGGDALTEPVSFEEAEFHPKPSDIYLSRRGDPVRRVVSTDESDRCPRVSPEGDALAHLQGSTLVVAPLDDVGEPGAPQVRAHLPASPSECPQWSPDGRSVGYVAVLGDPDTPLYTTRPAEVHAVTLDGDDRVVAAFETQVWHQPAFAWSPDGKAVAYTTETGVWLAPLGGEPELLWRPAAGDPSEELPMAYDRPTSVAWSPSGEIALIVYASEPDDPNDPYGTGTESWTVRVLNPESGRVQQVGAAAGSGAAAWSPDGGRLAFAGPDGRIRVHALASGSTDVLRPGLGGRDGVWDVAWSPSGDRLMAFTRSGARGYALASFAIDGTDTELRTPWTWALDWIGLEDVDWSSR